jgi:class III poly(R)-hydroxyalkanoic acid synthase PhaE subunit
MTDKTKDKASPESMFTDWMQTATTFWDSMASVWSSAAEAAEMTTKSKKGDQKNRTQDSWEAAQNTWQALFTAMSKPQTLEALFKSTDELPEILVKLGQANLSSFIQFQKQWMEKTAEIQNSGKVFSFEELDQDFFKTWNQLYETELSTFFHIPPIGPARFYQEKLSRVVDKFNLFQAAMAEFFHFLYLPVENSFKIMQAKLTESAQKGQSLEDFQDYYKIWVKILEEQYMTLFKSSEYTQTLSKALDSMAEFSIARQEILGDIMAMFSLPTPKDMDAVYKEIYELKQRIKELEKGKSLLNRGKK